MKTPDQIRQTFIRWWDDASSRTRRLTDASAWPAEVALGRPSPTKLRDHPADVAKLIDRWRKDPIGRIEGVVVVWTDRAYRATGGVVSLPRCVRIEKPSAWIAATGDDRIVDEFQKLQRIVAAAEPSLHETLIRRRPAWRDRPLAEVVTACHMATRLTPGHAEGRPLRMLTFPESIGDVDTKFFERNRTLMTALLDVLHDGAVGTLGLETFLDAAPETDRWVLIADLDGGWMPFPRLRVRTSDLAGRGLPHRNILVVENEKPVHVLPSLEHTAAVLGCGFDVGWMSAPWLDKCRVAYWGDIDTWGLSFLAHARHHRPKLHAILMDRDAYDCGIRQAVPEPTPAPAAHRYRECLTGPERDLDEFLRRQSKGRMEQEFMDPRVIVKEVRQWHRDPTVVNP